MTPDALQTTIQVDGFGRAHLMYAGSSYGPVMRSKEDAQAFLRAFHNRTGLDARHADEGRLAAAYKAWTKADKQAKESA